MFIQPLLSGLPISSGTGMVHATAAHTEPGLRRSARRFLEAALRHDLIELIETVIIYQAGAVDS